MVALKELYGHTLAREFSPLALKALRQKLLEAGLSRGVINQRIGRVKRLFKWAVSEGLVPAEVCQALQTVEGLKRGRTTARETEPIKPVADDLVERTLPHLNHQVGAMVRLQRLTGMRPSEVTIMRTVDIDMSGPVWLYRPASHKMQHRGKERIIALGPQAQAIIKTVLKTNGEAYLFSPLDARNERYAAMRSARKTSIQPSQRCRSLKNPRRQPGDHYSYRSYHEAIQRACERAGLPHWHPHQLRHSHATEIRRQFGLEAAQVALGHSSADVTQIYAERDLRLAIKIAETNG
jgi:integrase